MAKAVVTTADAVVIGAGPAGAAAAYFLARAGHDVIALDKETFPREKVCGDGLTPRAVKAMRMLGLHDEADGRIPGWARQEGLRMHGGGVVVELGWPELDDWPSHSVTATRALFDDTLARNAEKAGARLWEQTEVTGPVYRDATEARVAGVSYRRADGAEGVIRAPIVIVADGGSSRFAVELGLHRDERRPMGVAVRAYYRSPLSGSDMMEGFLNLRAGGQDSEGELLPGYGWIFPLDDGLVNVGWGLLNSSRHFRSTNYRRTLEDWITGLPAEWEISPSTQVGRARSAGLPMGHSRRPHLHRGALLVGDAGGMINPFNGEGISYAIEAAALAAEAADEAIRARSDAPLRRYPEALAREWGGYFTLGRAFVRVMGNPAVMRACTVYGMPHPGLMRFVLRTMAHLTNRRSVDFTDRLLNTLARAVPAA